MEPPEIGTSSTDDGICHFVHIHPHVVPRYRRAESKTLSPDLCAKLHPIASTIYRRVVNAKAVDAFCKQHGIRGLVLCFATESRSVPIPNPLQVPIEPLELDEAKSPLHEIVHDAPAPAAQSVKRTRRWKRFFIRMAVPIAFIGIVLNPLIQAIIRWRSIWWWGATGAAIIFLIVLSMMVSGARQGLIVPGGLLMRSRFRRRPDALRLFTPSDTLLSVHNASPGYHVTLWNDGKASAYLRATELELAALLAAWQSPLPPPTMDRLSEFR